MLVDPVVEDMRILGNINMFFAEQNGPTRESGGGERQGRRIARAARARRRSLPQGARQAALPRASRTSSSRPRSAGRSAALAPRSSTTATAAEGTALAGLPVPEPAARRREPHPRRAAQLPLLRPGVHRGADPDGPQRRPPLAALAPGPGDPWQIEPLEAFTRSGGRAAAREGSSRPPPTANGQASSSDRPPAHSRHAEAGER